MQVVLQCRMPYVDNVDRQRMVSQGQASVVLRCKASLTGDILPREAYNLRAQTTAVAILPAIPEIQQKLARQPDAPFICISHQGNNTYSMSHALPA